MRSFTPPPLPVTVTYTATIPSDAWLSALPKSLSSAPNPVQVTGATSNDSTGSVTIAPDGITILVHRHTLGCRTLVLSFVVQDTTGKIQGTGTEVQIQPTENIQYAPTWTANGANLDFSQPYGTVSFLLGITNGQTAPQYAVIDPSADNEITIFG